MICCAFNVNIHIAHPVAVTLSVTMQTGKWHHFSSHSHEIISLKDAINKTVGSALTF